MIKSPTYTKGKRRKQHNLNAISIIPPSFKIIHVPLQDHLRQVQHVGH
jgi:hypothetical protein